MAQTTDEVRAEVDWAFDRLAQDLNRLEYRFQEASDWHTWFWRYPLIFTGAAFLGALLLGFAVMPGRKRLYRAV